MNFNQKYMLALWTYDLYGPVRNAFDEGKSITRASWRGWAGGNRDFFGPSEIASSRQANGIRGPKKVSIFRAWSIEIFTSIFHFNRKQNKCDKFCIFRFFSHLIFRSNQNQNQIKVINFASFSLRFALSENERRTL